MKVQKQITLPFSKAWEISLRSIRIRLARSLITASGILLGVAFYSSVRTSSLFPVEGWGGRSSGGHRQQWLAIMALIVCFFRHYERHADVCDRALQRDRNMKCLGALNRFVVTLSLSKRA